MAGVAPIRTTAENDVLVPIDEVARRLGLRASTIRYYEERGLVTPVSRHSGRRWYGPGEIRTLAVIRYWQQSGLMSLDEIGAILAGPASSAQWAEIIERRIVALRDQIGRMEDACSFLEHVRSHHPDNAPDGCPHYEALIHAPHERSNASPDGTAPEGGARQVHHADHRRTPRRVAG